MQSSKVGRPSGYVSAFAPITRTEQALASLNKAHLMPILSYILVLNHSISPVILWIARCSPRNYRGGTRTCRSRWLQEPWELSDRLCLPSQTRSVWRINTVYGLIEKQISANTKKWQVKIWKWPWLITLWLFTAHHKPCTCTRLTGTRCTI